MNKKPTVRDVAAKAGVSVATVSYIMNDRKDQKISEETRKKVLQIANLLNYQPSHAAKTLATGKTNIIGVAYILDHTRPSRNMEIIHLVDQLIDKLNRMNYDVIFLSTDLTSNHLPLNGKIDGIVAIDLTNDQFHHLANNYLVPIISVDMLVNDNLFYQIYTDYPAKIKEISSIVGEDILLISDQFLNEKYTSFVCKNSPKVIYSNELTKDFLKTLKEEKVIVIGNYLGLLLAPYVKPENLFLITSADESSLFPADVKRILIDHNKQANFIINILINAIDRKFEIDHDYPM